MSYVGDRRLIDELIIDQTKPFNTHVRKLCKLYRLKTTKIREKIEIKRKILQIYTAED